MFYYLYCKTPCAVKVNGEYLGIASVNLKYFEGENCFLELIPLDAHFVQTRVYLNKNILNEQKNCRIIDLYGGFLIIPNFTKQFSNDFTVIGKKTFDFTYPLTVFCYNQGGVKLVLSNKLDVAVESIPFLPEDVRFESCRFNGKEYLVVVCVGKRSLILAFSIGEKITRVFKNLCDGYGFEKNKLFTVENKNDILKHSLSSTWEFGETLSLKSCSITTKRPIYSLPTKLIPYAFFEEIILGGDVANFLSPRLKPRAKEIGGFLGSFEEVLPPFHFSDDDCVVLLYKDKVEYAKLELLGGLVDNLTLL